MPGFTGYRAAGNPMNAGFHGALARGESPVSRGTGPGRTAVRAAREGPLRRAVPGPAGLRRRTMPHGKLVAITVRSGGSAVEQFLGELGQLHARMLSVGQDRVDPRARPADRGDPVQGVLAAE